MIFDALEQQKFLIAAPGAQAEKGAESLVQRDSSLQAEYCIDGIVTHAPG